MVTIPWSLLKFLLDMENKYHKELSLNSATFVFI